MKTRALHHQYPYIMTGWLVVAVAMLFLAGPMLISGPIATVIIGDNNQRIVLSGHRFRCDGQDPRKVVARCKTSLKGQSLELAFTYRQDLWATMEQCTAKYDGKVLPCSGSYDYRLRQHQVDVWIKDDLGLTDSDRWWLLRENPLVNVSQPDWEKYAPSIALVVSSLFGLEIWLKSRALMASVGTVVIMLPVVWLLTILLLLFAGYVD